MSNSARVARDISYAHSAETRAGRAMIRAMEALSGRGRLIRRAAGYEQEVAQGRDFWAVMVDRYGLRLELSGGDLADIPRDGPLIVIANHPYGILDGLIMGHILASTRGEFRILANSVFRKAEELSRVVLPVSFAETREAVQMNLETRRRSLEFLGQGGAIGIFPGGAVSTAARPFSTPLDPGWRGFTARMIARSRATVVPIYFAGHTSRMFQIASHMHPTLRMGLLIKEFGKRVDGPVQVRIGQPLGPGDLAPLMADTKSLMAFLRRKTYELSDGPGDPDAVGYEWD